MYNLKLNNYHQKPKSSIIYTPSTVSQFIFELLRDEFTHQSLIFDPCSGTNSLLNPWFQTGYRTWGNDHDSQLKKGIANSNLDFLISEKRDWVRLLKNRKPALIPCNPPFNGYGHQLASEVWLDKIIELFGKEVPIVLFAPMGFRLNSKKQGKRWTKFTQGNYPPISSIISLPRNIFPSVEFHSEILIFNLPNLQPHYFYHEKP